MITINERPTKIAPPIVNFTWSPIASPIGITINGNTYPPGGSKFTAYRTPINTLLTFTAQVNADPRAPIVQYRWDTGDGYVKFGSSITHRYVIPNQALMMNLEITDSLGRKKSVSHTLQLESVFGVVVTEFDINPGTVGFTTVKWPTSTNRPTSTSVPSST